MEGLLGKSFALKGLGMPGNFATPVQVGKGFVRSFSISNHIE